MDAIQFDAKRLKLSLVKADIPKRKGDEEVVVMVAYSGICGTDLHIVEGHFPCSSEPVIMGHEFCGFAVDVGSKVTHIKKGDRVVVDPNSGCYTCGDCSHGRYQHCRTGGINGTVGIWKNGGWSQYCAVPASQVYRIPDSISFEQAALTEPLSCIAHGWDRVAPIPVGSHILVQGAGIIGNLWACVLHLQGHKQVIVSEPQPARRELFGRLETGYECVAPDQLRVLKESGGEEWGFDVVVDCSGSGPAMEQGLDLLRPGGRLVVFGVASPEAVMRVSPFKMFKKELTILGVLMNPYTFPKSLGFIDAMGSRYLSFDKLGIQVFSLDQFEKALNALKQGVISKAIFKVKISPFQIYKRELSIIGVLINPYSFPNSLGLIDAMGIGYLDYEKLGIKVFPLNQYEEAFKALKTGVISKAVFKIK